MSQVDTLNSKDLRFSLMFFACTEDTLGGAKYRLITESARFADEHDFEGVWIPERHFTGFGFLYPNPAVLHAALARETKKIKLRAGSVVAPLHNPLRIAEEWSMVDNLSAGRVGISFAPGWNPNDFAFFPERYSNRQERLYETVAVVKKLWKGESIETLNGSGETVPIRIYPGPVQAELPIWITAAGSPKTFIRAGQMGANVLTHLLDHGVDEIAANIALYRQARKDSGYDPRTGEVTLMLHTFLGSDAEEVRELVRTPYCNWLKSNAGLLKGLAANRGNQIDLDALSESDRDAFVNLIFERFFSSRSLMGTPEMCVELLSKLQSVGVTEVASLLDFGPAEEIVLEHLPHLLRLKDLYQAQGAIAPAPEREVRDKMAAFAEPKGPKANTDSPMKTASLEEIRMRCQEVSTADFYSMLCRFGAQVDGRFRGLNRLWRGKGEALAQVQLREELRSEVNGYRLHPAFLDSCFQVFAAMLPDSVTEQEDALYLPVALKSFEFWGQSPKVLWSHALLTSYGSVDHFEGDIHLLDESGQPQGKVTGFKLQRMASAGSQRGEDLADWFYGIRWIEKAFATAESPEGGSRWLLFADSGGMGTALAATLTKAGDKCQLVYRGDQRKNANTSEYWINPSSEAQMRWLVQDTLKSSDQPLRGIIHLWSLDSRPVEQTSAETLEQDQLLGPGSALYLVKACAQAEQVTQKPRLWFVTRGAQFIPQDPRPVSPTQATLWGFGSSIAAEHRELLGGLIDLDSQDSAESAAGVLASVLRNTTPEDQIAVRSQQTFVRRLERRREPVQPAPAFKDDATYLITGGFGGIGLKVGEWLVAHGARNLIMLGRNAPPPRSDWANVAPGTRAARQIAAVRDLEAQGARIIFASIDVADESAVSAFFRDRVAEFPPVRGILHTAGIGRGDTLVKLDMSTVTEVLRPKVAGTWVLHQISQQFPLDFFVLFSSATHQLGVLGQGAAAYSAASAFLDTFAQYRRTISQAALSIDWGPWSKVGMAAETGNVARLQGFGIGSVSPRRGTDALGHLLNREAAQAWVIGVNWQQLVGVDSSLTQWPFVSELVAEAAPGGESAEEVARRMELLASLRRLPVKARAKRLEAFIQDQIVSVMGLESVGDVDWRRGLFDIGMDSLMALNLKNRLQSDLGIPISSTLVFDHPTVESIASFLSQQIFPEDVHAKDAPAAGSGLEQDVLAAAEEIRGLDEQEMEQMLEKKLSTTR